MWQRRTRIALRGLCRTVAREVATRNLSTSSTSVGFISSSLTEWHAQPESVESRESNRLGGLLLLALHSASLQVSNSYYFWVCQGPSRETPPLICISHHHCNYVCLCTILCGSMQMAQSPLASATHILVPEVMHLLCSMGSPLCLSSGAEWQQRCFEVALRRAFCHARTRLLAAADESPQGAVWSARKGS